MEAQVLLFGRVFLVHEVLEGLQALVRRSALLTRDDVVLRLRERDQGPDVAALQHAIEVARPGMELDGSLDRRLRLRRGSLGRSGQERRRRQEGREEENRAR